MCLLKLLKYNTAKISVHYHSFLSFSVPWFPFTFGHTIIILLLTTWPLPFISHLTYYNFPFSFLSIFTFALSSSSKVLLSFVWSRFTSYNTHMSCIFKAVYTLFCLSIWTGSILCFPSLDFLLFLSKNLKSPYSFPNSNICFSLHHEVSPKLSIAVNETNTKGREK